jgi:hypothetical protein
MIVMQETAACIGMQIFYQGYETEKKQCNNCQLYGVCGKHNDLEFMDHHIT